MPASRISGDHESERVISHLEDACEALVSAVEAGGALDTTTMSRERCAYLAHRLGWMAWYGSDLARILHGLATADAACLDDADGTTGDVLAAATHHAHNAEEAFREAWRAAQATRCTYEPLLVSEAPELAPPETETR